MLRKNKSHSKARLILTPGIVIAIAAFAQSDRKHAYQAHIDKVRRLLPPHSALPPVLDLSKPNGENTGASRAWEDRFTGMMSVRAIKDPGIAYPSDAASIATTFTEYGAPVWALPVHDCVVFIGEPMSSVSRLAYNYRFVYSTSVVRISDVLKTDRRAGVREGGKITVAQFGGTIRFPSGHVETFLMAQEGFIAVGHRYLFFVWKPVESDNTYVVAEVYLIEGGTVFPINLDAHELRYAGMPFLKFQAKVRAAIANNVDTN